MIVKICVHRVRIEYLEGDDLVELNESDEQQLQEFIKNNYVSGQFESLDDEGNTRTVGWSIE